MVYGVWGLKFQCSGVYIYTLHRVQSIAIPPKFGSGSAFNHMVRDLAPIDVFDVAVDEAEQEPPISINLRLKVFDVLLPHTLEELPHFVRVFRLWCYFVDVVHLFINELKVHLPCNVVTPSVVFHIVHPM